MRLLVLAASVLLLALGGRALVDYLEAWSRVSRDISLASHSAHDCARIYQTGPIHDHELRNAIMRACDTRADLGGRWVLVEVTKAWVAGLWICDSLHCGEYVLPALDRLGDYVYMVAIAVALAAGCVVYTGAQLVSQLAVAYAQHRLAAPRRYAPAYEVDLGGEHAVDLGGRAIEFTGRRAAAPFPRQ